MNPQSFNRYSYVYNQPLRYTDPTGHCAEVGDESCWSFAESLSRIYDDLSLTFLSNWDYGQLKFLEVLLQMDLPGRFGSQGVTLDTVLTMFTNLEALFNPLRPSEDWDRDGQGKYQNAVRAARQVYVDNGIDLFTIRNINNPLNANDFIGHGPLIEVIMIFNANNGAYGVHGIVGKLGLDNAPGANFEPNYLSALIVNNRELVQSIKVDLMITPLEQGWDNSELRKMYTWELFGIDTTGGS
jgi:hypothetical protein